MVLKIEFKANLMLISDEDLGKEAIARDIDEAMGLIKEWFYAGYLDGKMLNKNTLNIDVKQGIIHLKDSKNQIQTKDVEKALSKIESYLNGNPF